MLKDVLSKDALKSQAFLFQLHNTAPLNITSQCKVGAIPAEPHLCHGAKDAEACVFLGTNHCNEYHAMITRTRMVNGKHTILRCSRTTYGSGDDPGPDVFSIFQEIFGPSLFPDLKP